MIMLQWIDAKMRQPEPCTYVLGTVFNPTAWKPPKDKPYVTIVLYIGPHWIETDDRDSTPVEVTYWMELPEPKVP
jgi:Protein of unknown function (DUF551)